jgi:hypothetical protein
MARIEPDKSITSMMSMPLSSARSSFLTLIGRISAPTKEHEASGSQDARQIAQVGAKAARAPHEREHGADLHVRSPSVLQQRGRERATRDQQEREAEVLALPDGRLDVVPRVMYG